MSTTTLMDEFGLQRLTVNQRWQLMEELWKSISTTTGEIRLTPAQIEDLQKRDEQFRNDPTAWSSWEEIKTHLEKE